MCRAIRHLKLKHPEQMPEHNISQNDSMAQGTILEDEEEELQWVTFIN